jgi:hypothetical protein
MAHTTSNPTTTSGTCGYHAAHTYQPHARYAYMPKRDGHEGSWILQAGNTVQRTRGLQVQRPDTCAEYFGGIGAAALALKGMYESVAYFDNNCTAAETYNIHSPQVDQYASMAAVLKDSTCKGSFVQQARTAEIAFYGPPWTQNRGRPSVLWGNSWFPTWPSCRGAHRAGGCHQCVVRVRERSAPNAGSARTLLM